MSTNISKEKRDGLIRKIQSIRKYLSEAKQDENTGNLLMYLNELEKDVKGKKYGLIFEEHREAIDDLMDTHTPVLTEDKDLFIDNGGRMNFIIEGDNLPALKLLDKTHKGKIDLIYIDPPYNTGNNDFIYDDNYVNEDDGYRHSKWISLMRERLIVARDLLTIEGAIFIQINDVEIAQLKMICDEIFGESNFINIISVNMKNIAGASGGGEDKKFKKNCEYILIYARNYDYLPIFNNAYDYIEIWEMIEQYNKTGKSWKYTSVLLNEGDKKYIGSTVDGDGNDINIYIRENPIIKSVKQVARDEDITEKDVYYKYGNKIFQTAMPQSSIRPRVMQKVMELGIKGDFYSIEYVPRTGRNKGKVYEQFYKGESFRLLAWLRDVSEEIEGKLYKKTLQGTYWDFVAGTKNLTKEGNVEFNNGKKPLDLLKRIINLYPSKTLTVLDFFAGSGTTAHAVISLNYEDNGTRQFILCTNNENNICKEKTYRRIANVVNGYTTSTGKTFSPLPASLKYYKVDFIPISEKFYYEYADELLKHIRELVELENGINFTGNAEIAILLTDQELKDFVKIIDDFNKCRTIYLGHNVLFDGEQEQLFKKKEIEIKVIPNYYYRQMEG